MPILDIPIRNIHVIQKNFSFGISERKQFLSEGIFVTDTINFFIMRRKRVNRRVENALKSDENTSTTRNAF